MDNEIVNKSMVFYESFYDATKDLPVDRFREIWGALFEYAFYGLQPEGLSELATAIFKMAKPNIDTVVAKRTGGQKSANPMGTPMGDPMGNPMGKQSKPKGSKSVTIGSRGANHRVKGADPMGNDPAPIHIYDVDVDVDKDIDVDVDVDRQTADKESASDADASGGSQAGSTTPSYQDVMKECREQGYKANLASKFFMFYDKSQWKTKEGEPVKDWKKMLQIWNDNEHEEHPPNKKKKNGFDFEDQRHYNNDELEAAFLDLGGGEDG